MHIDINQIVKVDAKMYRHFAVLTIVVTLCVAFFADTGNRQAVADELDKRDQQVALRKAEEEKQAASHSTFTNKSSGPPMADDSGGAFGAPTDLGAGKGSATALALPRAQRSSGLQQACGRQAADRDALARMNKLQREAYLAKLDEMDCSSSQHEAEAHQPTQGEISALAAASAARSGANSVD